MSTRFGPIKRNAFNSSLIEAETLRDAHPEEYAAKSRRAKWMFLCLLFFMVLFCWWLFSQPGANYDPAPNRYQRAAEQAGCGSRAECDAIADTMSKACGDDGYAACK